MPKIRPIKSKSKILNGVRRLKNMLRGQKPVKRKTTKYNPNIA